MVPKARAETLSPLLPRKRISIPCPPVFDLRGPASPCRATPVSPGERRRDPARFTHYGALCSRPRKLSLGNHVLCALCFVRGQGQRLAQDPDRAAAAPEPVGGEEGERRGHQGEGRGPQNNAGGG